MVSLTSGQNPVVEGHFHHRARPAQKCPICFSLSLPVNNDLGKRSDMLKALAKVTDVKKGTDVSLTGFENFQDLSL